MFPFKADKQTELIFYCSLSIISPPFKAQTKSHHFAMHCRVRQCNGDGDDDDDGDDDGDDDDEDDDDEEGQTL